MNKKYYDGAAIVEVLSKHIESAEKYIELLKAFADVKGVDAVEVVRCKDCKYSVDEYDDGECYCDYDKCLRYVKDWNHYCSLAERKEE